MIFFLSVEEKIYLEYKVRRDFGVEDEMKKITIDDLIRNCEKKVEYITINSSFSGAATRFFYHFLVYMRHCAKNMLIITKSKLQSDLISCFLATYNIEGRVMEASEFENRSWTEAGFSHQIYNTVKHIIIYSAEDLHTFMSKEIYFSKQSFWQFVDYSQVLPINKDGMWVYPSYNEIEGYNVGLLGNVNILKFTTVLLSSYLPHKYINNGFNGPKPAVLKVENLLEWIINDINVKNSKNYAILFQRNSYVKEAYYYFKERGLNVEKKDNDECNINFYSESPKLMTYYQSKGLLFDTVIIPINYKEISKRSFGIAASTAVNKLVVIYESEKPDFLDDISPELYSEDY